MNTSLDTDSPQIHDFAVAPIPMPVAQQVAGRSHTPCTSGHAISLTPVVLLVEFARSKKRAGLDTGSDHASSDFWGTCQQSFWTGIGNGYLRKVPQKHNSYSTDFHSFLRKSKHFSYSGCSGNTIRCANRGVAQNESEKSCRTRHSIVRTHRLKIHTLITKAPSAWNPSMAGCDRMGLETPYGGDEARAADSDLAIGRSSQNLPLLLNPSSFPKPRVGAARSNETLIHREE